MEDRWLWFVVEFDGDTLTEAINAFLVLVFIVEITMTMVIFVTHLVLDGVDNHGLFGLQYLLLLEVSVDELNHLVTLLFQKLIDALKQICILITFIYLHVFKQIFKYQLTNLSSLLLYFIFILTFFNIFNNLSESFPFIQ